MTDLSNILFNMFQQVCANIANKYCRTVGEIWRNLYVDNGKYKTNEPINLGCVCHCPIFALKAIVTVVLQIISVQEQEVFDNERKDFANYCYCKFNIPIFIAV